MSDAGASATGAPSLGGSFEKITLRRLEPAKHSRNALVAHARRGHKRTVRLRALGEERGGILSVVRVDEVDGEVVLGRILTAARECHASRSATLTTYRLFWNQKRNVCVPFAAMKPVGGCTRKTCAAVHFT